MSYCFYYKFERQGCSCSCDCFLPLILVEKDVVKFRASEAAIHGVIRKIIYMTNEIKSISVRDTQFLVNSLFYASTFIKSEFLRI